MPVRGGEETKVLDSVEGNAFSIVDKGIYFNRTRPALPLPRGKSRVTRQVGTDSEQQRHAGGARDHEQLQHIGILSGPIKRGASPPITPIRYLPNVGSTLVVEECLGFSRPE
jgi:hypothetical protein